MDLGDDVALKGGSSAVAAHHSDSNHLPVTPTPTSNNASTASVSQNSEDLTAAVETPTTISEIEKSPSIHSDVAASGNQDPLAAQGSNEVLTGRNNNSKTPAGPSRMSATEMSLSPDGEGKSLIKAAHAANESPSATHSENGTAIVHTSGERTQSEVTHDRLTVSPLEDLCLIGTESKNFDYATDFSLGTIQANSKQDHSFEQRAFIDVLVYGDDDIAMSDDECDVEQDCDLIRVTGSGIDCVDGQYTLKGFFNGAPLFENTCGIAMVRQISQGESRWTIAPSPHRVSNWNKTTASSQTDQPLNEYYATSSTHPCPPLEGWIPCKKEVCRVPVIEKLPFFEFGSRNNHLPRSDGNHFAQRDDDLTSGLLADQDSSNSLDESHLDSGLTLRGESNGKLTGAPGGPRISISPITHTVTLKNALAALSEVDDELSEQMGIDVDDQAIALARQRLAIVPPNLIGRNVTEELERLRRIVVKAMPLGRTALREHCSMLVSSSSLFRGRRNRATKVLVKIVQRSSSPDFSPGTGQAVTKDHAVEWLARAIIKILELKDDHAMSDVAWRSVWEPHGVPQIHISSSEDSDQSGDAEENSASALSWTNIGSGGRNRPRSSAGGRAQAKLPKQKRRKSVSDEEFEKIYEWVQNAIQKKGMRKENALQYACSHILENRCTLPSLRIRMWRRDREANKNNGKPTNRTSANSLQVRDKGRGATTPVSTSMAHRRRGMLQKQDFDTDEQEGVPLGEKYQAIIPTLRTRPPLMDSEDERLGGKCVWTPTGLDTDALEDYSNIAKELASVLKPPMITNGDALVPSEDRIEVYMKHLFARGDIDEALQSLDRCSFKTTHWSLDDVRRFERALFQYGESFHLVARYMGTKSRRDAVEFFFYKQQQRTSKKRSRKSY